jgi:hypothetical protein
MSLRKKILIILLIILAIGAIYVGFQYKMASDKNLTSGTHKMLLLLADPSEQRPGIGAVDMAFVVYVVDGNVKNMTPVYPGGMAHPTESAPAEVQAQGVSQLLLHDSLWYKDTEKDAKLAQEIVEYNTGMKTDSVVIITPDAVDALIKSIGGVQVAGQGNVTGNTIEFVRDEQNYGGSSRGNAVESVMKPLLNATKDKNKTNAMLNAAVDQYLKGNIVVIPSDLFIQYALSKGVAVI